uniref:Uncharacterized protein n=1 Tax=Spironucleus salmonicida TaxID=348837 RepID=V6LH78_9EUKA|eukprot:EST43915.1 Hypothetical protein SS50377_16216 [Spironucleus salmonicida]
MFLPSFQLPLPSPLTEHKEKLEFIEDAKLYVKIQKLLFKDKLYQHFSMQKLWILIGVTQKYEDFIIDEKFILLLFKVQYQEHDRITSKLSKLQYLQNEFLYQNPQSNQCKKLPDNINPELISLVEDLYRSDELKLFDSFSGPLYSSQKPKENLTLFQTLGSGFLQQCAISDCIYEASLLQQIFIKILQFLRAIPGEKINFIALITKRIVFQTLVGQIFSTKLKIQSIFTIPFLVLSDVRIYSGFEVYNTFLNLSQSYPQINKIVENLQVFPNSFDILMKNYTDQEILDIGQHNILQLCQYNIPLQNFKQKRNLQDECMQIFDQQQFQFYLDQIKTQ